MDKVMVVDDNIVNLQVFSLLLEDEGFEVLQALSGEEAVDMAQESPVLRAIFMDVEMPGLDGIQTTRLIRMVDGHDRTPIIVNTAYLDDARRSRATQAGATAVVEKPLDFDQLIQHWLR